MVTEFECFADCAATGRPVVLKACTIESLETGSVTAFTSCSHAKRCSSEHGSVLDIPACALHHVEHIAPATGGASPANGCASSPISVVLPGAIADLVPGFLENRRKEARELALALQASDWERLDCLAQRMVGVGAMYGFDAITTRGRAIRKALADKRWRELRGAVSDYGSYLARIVVTYSGCAIGESAPPASPPVQRSPAATHAPHERRSPRFPRQARLPQPALAARQA